jgi:hypothetical protein
VPFVVRCLLCSSLALVGQSWQVAQGAIITYDFSGSVILAPSSVYGYTVAAPATVRGQFSYDTASVGTTSGATTYYPQTLNNGFTATFGALQASASSYQVEVTQDLLQPNKSFADEFTVSFASNANPAPTEPLLVGGTAESIGQLTIVLVGPTSVFSSSALPTTLSEASFTSNAGLFSQTTGFVDVYFSVTSLQAVPEPDGRVLSLIGCLLVMAARRRTGRFRRALLGDRRRRDPFGGKSRPS